MKPSIVCVLVLCLSAWNAHAQTIYEPVRYQHDRSNPFFYGGDDPAVFRFARSVVSPGGTYGRINGAAFDGAHRTVSSRGVRVFSDAIPGYNARIFGFTPDDARADALSRVPRYFSKRDLLSNGHANGRAWIVPSGVSSERQIPRGSIEIRPYVAPSTRPSRVIIIPKSLLDRRLDEYIETQES